MADIFLRQKILTGFKEILEDIDTISLNHVEINRSTPVDLDIVPFPACFIYSGPEELAADEEQVVGHETFKWEVVIEAWLKEGDVSEEYLLGEVHKAIFADYTLGGNAAYSRRIGSQFQVLDPDRAMRAMRINYVVTYRHRIGQPDII